MSFGRVSLCSALLVTLATPVWAGGLPLGQDNLSSANPAAPVASLNVDTSALQYYASRHETERVEAEIRRLRSLYPSWVPPSDPAAIPLEDQSASEQPLWDLFKADRLDELTAEIARRQSANAGWKPSEDLAGKLAVKLARRDLVKASDAKNYPSVVAAADKAPALLGSDDLDVLWRAQEAYAHVGREPKAFELAKLVLDKVDDPAARLTTVQKSITLLDPPDLKALIAMGKTGPDGVNEFQPVELDLIRNKLGRILSGSAGESIDPSEISRLESVARLPGGSTDDARLLGWYYAGQKDWKTALPWFKLAVASLQGPEKASPEDLKLVEGTARAMKELGRRPEAESLAWQWHSAAPGLGAVVIESVSVDLTQPKPQPVDTTRLQRFVTLMQAARSADGAQALGWYAYNVGQFPVAKAWFDKAMVWGANETIALGYALTLQRLGENDLAASFVAENSPQFPRLAALLKPARGKVKPSAPTENVDDQAVAPEPAKPAPVRNGLAEAYRRKDYGACLRIAAAREAAGGLTAQESLQKGWCLLAVSRPQEAALAFAAAMANPATATDAAYGASLAQIRSGQTGDALQSANSAPLASDRRNEIGVAILAQRAAQAFDAKHYKEALALLDQRRGFAAEDRDLSTLRAWCLYHLGENSAARDLFARLDAQLSTSETRAGLAVVGN